MTEMLAANVARDTRTLHWLYYIRRMATVVGITEDIGLRGI